MITFYKNEEIVINNPKISEPYYAIELERAIYCADCEHIFRYGFNKEGSRCPVCSSGAVYPISHWIKSMK